MYWTYPCPPSRRCLKLNTFLPYPDFNASAISLDDNRLGKQRAECKQIWKSLTIPTYGWKSHPAVKMWQGYEEALCMYAFYVCGEWRQRGYQDNLEQWFRERCCDVLSETIMPHWMGGLIHITHQSNLLRKYPEWYSRFNWNVPNDLEYVWPEGKANG